MPREIRNLTDTQLVILSAAARRDDGVVLPLPDSLTLNKGAAASVLKGLIRKRLIEEWPAPAGAEVWREGDDGERITLVITDAGLSAIGIEPEEAAEGSSASKSTARAGIPAKRPGKSSRGRSAPSAKPGKAGRCATDTAPVRPVRGRTRQAALISLLERKTGATIPALSSAFGWQPHSARAAISGLRKRGLKVARTRNEAGVTVYCIAGGA